MNPLIVWLVLSAFVIGTLYIPVLVESIGDLTADGEGTCPNCGDCKANTFRSLVVSCARCGYNYFH